MQDKKENWKICLQAYQWRHMASGTAVRSKIAEGFKQRYFYQTVAEVYREENKPSIFRTKNTDLLASDKKRQTSSCASM